MEARSGQNDYTSDISRNSKSSFSKIPAVNFCIRFWIDALVLLQDSYTEVSGFIPYISLNASIKISIDNFFHSRKRFFFKIKRMFNLSFLCHLDKKNRSATARPVNINNWNFLRLFCNNFFRYYGSSETKNENKFENVCWRTSFYDFCMPKTAKSIDFVDFETYFYPKQ